MKIINTKKLKEQKTIKKEIDGLMIKINNNMEELCKSWLSKEQERDLQKIDMEKYNDLIVKVICDKIT
jgi:hypothetical protein